MAYKIEDIDWSKMPEGATEFSLENGDCYFTWHDDNNCYLVSEISTEWQNHENEFDYDERVRYKVSDYSPSPTNSTMRDKEKVEHFLNELSELSNKYKIEIYGCGCCGSPNLNLEGFVEGGCYTVAKDNSWLEYGNKG